MGGRGTFDGRLLMGESWRSEPGPLAYCKGKNANFKPVNIGWDYKTRSAISILSLTYGLEL